MACTENKCTSTVVWKGYCRKHEGQHAQANPVELDVGDRVAVRTNNGIYKGVVMFHGSTFFADGVWVGVQLNLTMGKSDGAVKGERYFTCQEGHGVFARPNNVQPLDQLFVDDPVVVTCRNGTRTGVLRFRGFTQFAAGPWFGVELDTELATTDGSVNGVTYFSCASGRGLFCRPHTVYPAGTSPPQPSTPPLLTRRVLAAGLDGSLALQRLQVWARLQASSTVYKSSRQLHAVQLKDRQLHQHRKRPPNKQPAADPLLLAVDPDKPQGSGGGEGDGDGGSGGGGGAGAGADEVAAVRDPDKDIAVLHALEKQFLDPVKLASPGQLRHFVLDGYLQKVGRTGSRRYYFLLLSDVLLYAVPSAKGLLLPTQMRLKDTHVMPTKHECGFGLTDGATSFDVVAKDKAMRLKWMSALVCAVASQHPANSQEADVALSHSDDTQMLDKYFNGDNSSVFVTIKEARGLNLRPAGGTCDLFASVQFPSPKQSQVRQHTTRTLKNTKPNWDETFQLAITNKDFLLVHIWNANIVSKNQLLGEVRVPWWEYEENRVHEKWFPLMPGKKHEEVSGNVHLSFVYRARDLVQRGPLMQMLIAPDLIMATAVLETSNALAAKPTDVLKAVFKVFQNDTFKASMELIKTFVAREVQRPKNITGLFRVNNVATGLLAVCTDQTASQFLRELLRPILLDIIGDKRDYEIDPARMGKEQTEPDIRENAGRLAAKVALIIDALRGSLDDGKMPIHFRWLAKITQEQVEQHWAHENTSTAVRNTMASLLFLRFVCPAIVAPVRFGILDKQPPQKARRTLILVSKVMQTVANQQARNKKEPFMDVMQRYLFKNWDAAKRLLVCLPQVGEKVVSKEEDGARREAEGTIQKNVEAVSKDEDGARKEVQGAVPKNVELPLAFEDFAPGALHEATETISTFIKGHVGPILEYLDKVRNDALETETDDMDLPEAPLAPQSPASAPSPSQSPDSEQATITTTTTTTTNTKTGTNTNTNTRTSKRQAPPPARVSDLVEFYSSFLRQFYDTSDKEASA